jgi:N-acyl-D-aspartate/D-glutamate deacylase
VTTTTPPVAPPAPAVATTVAPPPAEPPTSLAPAWHDLVITGGRVIDPDSGTDALMDVGIDGGTVTALSAGGLRGRTTIDATGQVVAPGFIDLLSYDPNPYGVPFKVADGVTTNLCMHGINDDPGPWFAARLAEPTPVHHGGAFDHAWARSRLGVGVHERAAPLQVEALRTSAAAALAGGFIGVHLELEYTPGVALDEVVAMASVAAASQVPALFHARHSDPLPPGTNAEALEEVIAVARATGAAVHVEHLTSTGGTRTMAASLAALQAARDEGLDVTGDLYPYDSWATYAGSTRFDAGWQERFAIGYGDLLVPGTSARLTPATFAAARRANDLVAAMAIPEEDVRAGLRSPILMLGSDAILEPGDNNHPRAAGTFARVLGRYVRDERLLGLPAALAKMTIQPARRLEAGAPAMRRKGRLSLGADADITVFDPATVADRATLERPAQASTGITWVLVEGVVVRDPDGPRPDARPGRAIRSGA